MDLPGEYSFANTMNAGVRNPQEVNRVLLEEFKIREDVKLYIPLPDYDGFRGLDLPGEMELSAISGRFVRRLRNHHG